MSANVRISNLPSTTAAAIIDTDILPIVTGIASGVGVTSKVTIAELRLELGTTAPAGGRTVTSAATYLANNAVFNVKDFGAVGDGAADDYAAFVATHTALPATGGTIYIPQGNYKLTQAWNITKPVRLMGTLPASDATRFHSGTVLLFSADKHGIIFNNYITIDETTRAQDVNTPGANYSVMDGILVESLGGTTGLLNGGTAVDVDGIKIRTVGVTLRNVRVQYFKRDNISIRGSIGGAVSSVPEIEGSPNNWQLDNVTCLSSGRHNLYIHGADTNAGCSIRLNCSGAGQINLYDDSFLGNLHLAPHCNTSGTMDYKSNGTVSANLFINPYSEGGDARSIIMPPSMVFGGIFDMSAASTGLFMQVNGLMKHGGLAHQNTLGAQSVGIQFGKYDTAMQVLAFGSLDAGTYGENILTYDPTNKMWHLRNAGSASRDLISFPNSLNVNGTDIPVSTAAHKNGVYLGGPAGSTVIPNYFGYGTAAPVAGGPYKVGDIIINKVPALDTGVPWAWQCTVAGSPGTWVALSPVQTDTGWQNYTPDYTQQGLMTYTGITTNLARYRIVGKTLFVALDVIGTTGGTADSTIEIGLPTNVRTPVANKQWLPAFITDAAGEIGVARPIDASPTAYLSVQRVGGGAYTLGANRKVQFTGMFEIA